MGLERPGDLKYANIAETPFHFPPSVSVTEEEQSTFPFTAIPYLATIHKYDK